MKRLLAAALMAFSLPAHGMAEEVILTGPPIWDSAALIALAGDQPLAAEGITFTFRPWTSPEEMRKTVTSGQPAIAMAPVLMAPLMAARGMEVDLLAASVTGGSLWLIGRGTALRAPADLADRRITVPFQGNLPDLMLQRTLGEAKWQPLYTGSYPASMQFLLAGKADLALLAEPMASAALAADPDLSRLADLCPLWQQATDAPTCPPGGALIASPGLAARAGITAAISASFARLAEDPGRAHELLLGQFPDLAAAPGATAYDGISAALLHMPADQAALAGFYSEIFTIAPDAIGGALPAASFYEGGARP